MIAEKQDMAALVPPRMILFDSNNNELLKLTQIPSVQSLLMTQLFI